MEFTTTAALENYIKAQMRPAVIQATEVVYQVINRFVKEYYAEYSPVMYERTYQLYQSLVKTDITMTANGYTCEVYFDLSKLDYSVKKLNGTTVANKGWSEEKTLSAAAHGSHGGKARGTAIWDTPIKTLNKEAYRTLRRMLKANGIPVR